MPHRLPPLLLPVAVLLAVAVPWPAPPAAAAPEGAPPAAEAPAPAPVRQFGEKLVVDGCLTIAVTDFTDRAGDLPHDDWVSTLVQNRCPFGVRNLLVELELVDRRGRAYGRRIWLLARGEILVAGGDFKERYAVPDPDNLAATGWRMRVLRAERHR